MVDQKLRVGIIGAGMMTCNYDSPQSKNILTHAHAISLSDSFELAGFYDINSESRLRAADKWQTREFKTLLEVKEKSDIICCGVPDDVHYQILKQFYEADSVKGIICEKPITTNISEAEELICRFNSRHIPIIVNYSRRFMSAFRELKNEIRQYGKLIVGSCYYGKGLFHNCSHMINILDFLLDLSNYKCVEIFDCVMDHDANDLSVEFLMSDRQSKLFFHVIPCTVTTAFQFELFFEQGKVVYDDATEEIRCYDVEKSEKFAGYTNYKYSITRVANRNEALLTLYKDVERLIKSGGENYSDGGSAVSTLKKCIEISKIERGKL